MQERTLLRIGGVSLIVGFVLTIVHAALILVDAPLSDPGDTEVILQSIVDSSIWAGIHILTLVPFLLGVGGLRVVVSLFYAYSGFSPLAITISQASGIFLLAWALALAVLMWRRASTVDLTVSPSP